MSVTIVKCQRRVNDSASQSAQGLAADVEYNVWVAEAMADPMDVVLAEYTPPGDDDGTNWPMPQYGDAHSISADASVTNKVANRAINGSSPHPHMWIVRISFGVIAGVGGGVSSSGSTATSRNIVIRCTTMESATFTQNSGNGDQIKNAADDIYPDAQELGLYDRQFQITFECVNVDGPTIDAALGKLNAAAVTLNIPQGSKSWSRTFPPKTLKLKAWDYDITKPLAKSIAIPPPADVWSCNVVLQYRADTWLRKLPQKGYRWKVDGKLTEAGSTAEYLASTGAKLPAGQPIVAMDPGVQIEKTTNLTSLLATI